MNINFGNGNTITKIEKVEGNGNTIITGDGNTKNDIQLSNLLKEIEDNIPANTSPADRQSINDSIEIIKCESKEKEPKKSYIRNALDVLKRINAGTQFASAVAALYEFLRSFLPLP